MTMRNRLFVGLSACLYYSGLMRLVHWLHRRAGRRLLILNYHQAAGGELRRHLLYLKKHFRLQFVDQALEDLYGDTQKGKGRDRRLPLALTFDDGYLDNYTEAYRLARELQIPFTIFLISAYIDNGTAFWWFDHFVEKAQVERIETGGQAYQLCDPGEQQKLAEIVDTQIRSRTDAGEQQAYLRKLGEMLAIPGAVRALAEEMPVPLLTWAQVLEMQASGLVAFGGHTAHHATLAALSRVEQACEEVTLCQVLLREKLGQQIGVFAYPHGGIEHIGLNGMAAVRHAGYCWALTTLQGVNTPQTPPYLLRRISADSRFHWLLIAFMTSGIWDFLAYFNWLVKRRKHRKLLAAMRQI